MRCGDTVKHSPTGETWTVAYVDGEYMSWCGWPPGEAKTADCTVIEKCSDSEYLKLLKEIAGVKNPEDKRQRTARMELDALETAPASDVKVETFMTRIPGLREWFVTIGPLRIIFQWRSLPRR